MRETWIDQARGLCMLMVLWFHAEMYSGMGQKYSILITPFFMQAFFFLSGYLFVRNRQRFSYIDKMKRCVVGIWIPYIIFTTIMLVPKIYLHHWSISYGLMTILTGQASWFVYVLGLMQILVGGVIALTQRLGKAWPPPMFDDYCWRCLGKPRLCLLDSYLGKFSDCNVQNVAFLCLGNSL